MPNKRGGSSTVNYGSDRTEAMALDAGTVIGDSKQGTNNSVIFEKRDTFVFGENPDLMLLGHLVGNKGTREYMLYKRSKDERTR